MWLFAEVDALNAWRDAGQDFVANGATGLAKLVDGRVLAKDFHLVAHLALRVGDVDHAGVHAATAVRGRSLGNHSHFHSKRIVRRRHHKCRVCLRRGGCMARIPCKGVQGEEVPHGLASYRSNLGAMALPSHPQRP